MVLQASQVFRSLKCSFVGCYVTIEMTTTSF